MVKKKRTYPQWFIEELADSTIKQQAIEGILSTVSKVEFKCACGNTYIQKITNHINLSTGERKFGHCKECTKRISAQKYRDSLGTSKPYPDWFIDELVKDEDKVKAKEGKLKAADNVSFLCPICKEIYFQRVASHITLSTGEKKKGCPKCGIRKQIASSRKTKKIIKPYPQWFIDDLYSDEDKELAKSTNFFGKEEKQFYCKKHDLVYTQKVRSHLDLKTHSPKAGCPQCKVEKFRKSLNTDKPLPDWFTKDLVNKEDKQRAKEGKIKSNEKLDFQCKQNHIYKQEVHAHINLGTQEQLCGCPICAKQRSNTEINIEDFIKELGFKTEHRRFYSSVLSTFEIDIFIPDKNIGLEYNGSFWHKTLPQDFCFKPRLYHNQKYYACKELGIRLISIFDVDWEYRKDKIKQYLKDLLTPSTNRIYARKCEVKQISKEEANKMYEEYHLLGRTSVQSLSYGLFYNNKLLSCMSFQKGRYKEGKESVWCLTRFVTKSGCSIIGGASKLLTQFERDVKPSILVSFSDNDYFTGGVYSKLGFECLGDTGSPRYYWYLNGAELKREQCQLKFLSKQYPELYLESFNRTENKEDFIMVSLGAKKVYRSGHTKWIKRYS